LKSSFSEVQDFVQEEKDNKAESVDDSEIPAIKSSIEELRGELDQSESSREENKKLLLSLLDEKFKSYSDKMSAEADDSAGSDEQKDLEDKLSVVSEKIEELSEKINEIEDSEPPPPPPSSDAEDELTEKVSTISEKIEELSEKINEIEGLEPPPPPPVSDQPAGAAGDFDEVKQSIELLAQRVESVESSQRQTEDDGSGKSSETIDASDLSLQIKELSDRLNEIEGAEPPPPPPVSDIAHDGGANEEINSSLQKLAERIDSLQAEVSGSTGETVKPEQLSALTERVETLHDKVVSLEINKTASEDEEINLEEILEELKEESAEMESDEDESSEELAEEEADLETEQEVLQAREEESISEGESVKTSEKGEGLRADYDPNITIDNTERKFSDWVVIFNDPESNELNYKISTNNIFRKLYFEKG
jgi:DNA repair exonuclease SbcCD ATPase subunit